MANIYSYQTYASETDNKYRIQTQAYKIIELDLFFIGWNRTVNTLLQIESQCGLIIEYPL